jgi:hypothetical protein
MAEPFFLNPFFVNIIFPLVLVFTLVFAILEKSKLLGDDKKQINAIIGLVLGLFLISFPFARDIVVNLMPFLAVSVVILLVFMILYGFIYGKSDGEILDKYWKIAFSVIFFIALIFFFLHITGWSDIVYDFIFGRSAYGQLWINTVLILIIAGAVIAVIWSSNE